MVYPSSVFCSPSAPLNVIPSRIAAPAPMRLCSSAAPRAGDFLPCCDGAVGCRIDVCREPGSSV